VPRRVRAYVGLGANVGDARETLTAAVHALSALPEVRRCGVSRLYRTKPVGVVDQADFLNAVVAMDVPAGPDAATGATALLVALKHLERSFGRKRRRRWGPRELDLDLLLFGRARLAIDRPPEAVPLSGATDPAAAARLLEVPHPAMGDRLFVLAPLADLAPRLVPPGWHETIETARRRRAADEGPGAAVPVAIWDAARLSWPAPSGASIIVRRATARDAEEVARVHTESSEAAYRGLAPPDPNGFERRLAMWREALRRPGGRTFLALEGEHAVGMLNVGPARGDSGVGEVRTIYVLEGWWGSGAGQALIGLAHTELAAAYDEATLTVLAANARARRFYQRNGWRLEAIVTEPHFGGIPTEVARYRRSLRKAGTSKA
jgi:2-amino-4-hydroxy-6-hydroxymethyldihydropteridine diphosphokinase